MDLPGQLILQDYRLNEVALTSLFETLMALTICLEGCLLNGFAWTVAM